MARASQELEVKYVFICDWLAGWLTGSRWLWRWLQQQRQRRRGRWRWRHWLTIDVALTVLKLLFRYPCATFSHSLPLSLSYNLLTISLSLSQISPSSLAFRPLWLRLVILSLSLSFHTQIQIQTQRHCSFPHLNMGSLSHLSRKRVYSHLSHFFSITNTVLHSFASPTRTKVSSCFKSSFSLSSALKHSSRYIAAARCTSSQHEGAFSLSAYFCWHRSLDTIIIGASAREKPRAETKLKHKWEREIEIEKEREGGRVGVRESVFIEDI